MKSSRVLSAADTREWDKCADVLQRKGQYDIYFSWRYLKLYADKTKQAEAYVFEEDGELFFFPYIKSAVPKGLFPSEVYDFETAYGYGGTLSTSSDQGFLAKAWEGFHQHCQKSKIVCGFIRFHPLLENHKSAEGQCKVIKSNEVVTLSLPKSSEQVWKDYTGDTRNNIRKGQKNDVRIVAGENKESLKIFQKLYVTTMEQVGADEFYFFGDQYFDEIGEFLKGQFKVYIAYKDDVAIGGALVLSSEKFVHYHLSANIKSFRQYQPASMLRHQAIIDHLSRNKVMLFGGGGQTQQSLMKFKAGFSKERADFYIGCFMNDEKTYKAVCERWEGQSPDKAKQYKGYFLKYRF